MQVAPGATFETFSPALASGLTGTIGVRIRTSTGADFLPRTTAGIAADDTVGATSIYRATLTAPTTSGQYWVVWDNATTLSDPVELIVTFSAPTTSTGSVYATRNELKTALALTGQTYADADIDRACAAASRAIDNKTGRVFYTLSGTHYYTGNPHDNALDIIDTQTISTFTLDTAGNATFATTLTSGTDYDLEPFNAAETGRPYERVRLRPAVARTWPTYPRSVKVVGTFGWATIPDPVNQYATILASKLLKRTREAPFGVLAYGLDEQIAIRISRNDPDFELLLGNYVKTNPGV